MRSEGYGSCKCVCLSVCPQAILAVHAITSKTNKSVVLLKRRTWGNNKRVRKLERSEWQPFCLVQLCAMFCILSVTPLLTCYARAMSCHEPISAAKRRQGASSTENGDVLNRNFDLSITDHIGQLEKPHYASLYASCCMDLFQSEGVKEF